MEVACGKYMTCLNEGKIIILFYFFKTPTHSSFFDARIFLNPQITIKALESQQVNANIKGLTSNIWSSIVFFYLIMLSLSFSLMATKISAKRAKGFIFLF